MNILRTLAFGAAALAAATLATAAPAKADSFGFYVSNGVAVNNYGGGYYGYPAYYGYPGYGYANYGYAYRPYNRCADPWYRRHHRRCWSDGYYPNGYGYAYPYYYSYPSYSIGLGFPIYHHRHYYPQHFYGGWGHQGWGGWNGGHGRHGH